MIIMYNFSSFFLTGPLKQLKNMFKEKRLIATIVMLVCAAWERQFVKMLFREQSNDLFSAN